MRGEEMSKKRGLRVNKRWLLLTVVVLVFAGSLAGAYVVGQNKGKKATSQQQEVLTGADADIEQIEAEANPGSQAFADIKKQIEENKATGVDKMSLYINAATLGATLDAPEAAGYAKEALALMDNAMKSNARNRDLVASLEKIAAGNYE